MNVRPNLISPRTTESRNEFPEELANSATVLHFEILCGNFQCERRHNLQGFTGFKPRIPVFDTLSLLLAIAIIWECLRLLLAATYEDNALFKNPLDRKS